MEKKSRVFGSNMRFYLKQKGMQPEQLADRLGYSEYEIQKIMDSRLIAEETGQGERVKRAIC